MDSNPEQAARLPDRALHIVDSSRQLSAQMLQSALDVLTGNATSLSSPQYHAIPLTRISVDTLRDGFGNRKR